MKNQARQRLGTTTEIDDHALVEQALQHNDRAWQQVVRRFEPTLRSLIAEDADVDAVAHRTRRSADPRLHSACRERRTGVVRRRPKDGHA